MLLLPVPWHLHQGFPDPTSTPTVRKTLAGIARTHGKPKKKAKALPVEDLELIAAHLADTQTLRVKRDNALLQLDARGWFSWITYRTCRTIACGVAWPRARIVPAPISATSSAKAAGAMTVPCMAILKKLANFRKTPHWRCYAANHRSPTHDSPAVDWCRLQSQLGPLDGVRSL